MVIELNIMKYKILKYPMIHNFSCQDKILALQEAYEIPIHDGSLGSNGTNVYTAQICSACWRPGLYDTCTSKSGAICSFILFFITQNYTLVLGNF